MPREIFGILALLMQSLFTNLLVSLAKTSPNTDTNDQHPIIQAPPKRILLQGCLYLYAYEIFGVSSGRNVTSSKPAEIAICSHFA